MEDTWFKYLNRLDLAISSEKTRMRYIAHDWRSRKSYILGRQTAEALHTVKQYINGITSKEPSNDQMGVIYKFSEHIRRSYFAELSIKKPFNPLFVRWEIFDLGKFDDRLTQIARFVVPGFLILFVFSLLVCLYVLVNSGGEIFTQANTVLNLNGLAVFAALSPFLKIFHELGHALTARFYHTRLRSFGIMLVGLLPLPFVDCSMADFDANRRQRVLISLAGILTDIWIASLAFILWHISTGEILKTVYINIFVFSSLNSLLFNGNPLIRLDGYFAFSDMIGHRNLSSKAAQIFKAAKTYVVNFGKTGEFPNNKVDAFYLLYGLSSAFYKIYILSVVAWLVLPKFFGLGLIIVIWAGLVMFISPVLKSNETLGPKILKLNSYIFWAITCCLLTLLAFLPLPLKTTVPLSLDTEGAYAIRTKEQGVLTKTETKSEATKGDVLFTLANKALNESLEIKQLEKATVEIAYANAVETSPNETIAAQEQLITLEEEINELKSRLNRLIIRAQDNGHLYYYHNFHKTEFIRTGSNLGYYLPNRTQALMRANLNEIYVEDFQKTPPKVTLWDKNTGLISEKVNALTLELNQKLDPDTGARTFHLLFDIEQDPNILHTRNLYAKLNFGQRPIYEHLRRWYLGLWQNYLEVRINQGS